MPETPNIVLITTHDSGCHFGCYGVPTVRTPEIDRLAEDGCQFSNCFTATPQCSPSRASLLTGQYPQTNGVLGLAADPWGFTLSEPSHHLSARLDDLGYATALFGTQHEVLDVGELAFDRLPDGDVDPADEVAAAVASYVREDRTDPFYAQVGLFETHRPLDFGGMSPDDENGVAIPPYIADNETSRAEFAQLQGALRAVDSGVGRIRRALADAGIEDETILLFTSDHGISFARAKGYLYDPGIEIPLIVRWPDGGIEGGTVCDWLVSNVDVVPTLMELIDREARYTEGVSVAGAFRGREDPPRDAVFAQFYDHAEWGFGPHARCVRTRDHKLIRNFTPDTRFDPPVALGEWDQLGRDGKTVGPRPQVELYDLAVDPDEFDNLADDTKYADVRDSLDARLWDWLETVDDPGLEGVPASPYYEQSMADRPVDDAS